MKSSVRWSLCLLALVAGNAAAQDDCYCVDEPHPVTTPLSDEAVIFTGLVTSEQSVSVLRGIVGDAQGEMRLRPADECTETLSAGGAYLIFGSANGSLVTLDRCLSAHPLGEPPKKRRARAKFEQKMGEEEVTGLFLAGRWALSRAHVEMLQMDPRFRRAKKRLRKTGAQLDVLMKAHAQGVADLERGKLKKARAQLRIAEAAGHHVIGGPWRDDTLRGRIKRFREATSGK